MPMHDWTRVNAGEYHDFHGSWLYTLRDALNDGLLPADYYAAADQRLSGELTVGPDLLALRPPAGRPPAERHGVALAEPATALSAAVERRPRVGQRRLAVRHVSGDDIVAVVELVSPGNKESAREFRRFIGKLTDVLEVRLHLAVIDPFPPTARDPDGVHAAVWKRLRGKPPFRLPADRPLCATGYRSDVDGVKAYIQPFAAGGPVPPVPLYLAPDLYVTLPLEETYQTAFAKVPARWRERLTP
jgi:hypothetical protein